LKYATLKLPREFIERVRRFIEANPDLGYTSVPEFVKDAIREKLVELELVSRTKKIEKGVVE
jgi:hypothetical protein